MLRLRSARVASVLLVPLALTAQAYARGGGQVHEAVKQGDIDHIKTILARDPDAIHAVDGKGRTALHVAALHGHEEICRLLLAKGADVDATSTSGRTPLHLAAYRGYTDIVKLLIAHGANRNAKDRHGNTPMDSARARRHLTLAELLRPRISRELLFEDVRQLADVLESVHPDPYIRGGGKIAFHRRLHQVLAAIPDDGMTRNQFYWLLRPFVFEVGDSHTRIWNPAEGDPALRNAAPGGVPFRFDIVEKSLFVSAVHVDSFKDLLGSRLVSIEGVPFDEIRLRQARVVGAPNEYNMLQDLRFKGLWRRYLLEHIIPEWKDKRRIRLGFQDPDGTTREYEMDIPTTASIPAISIPSRVELPSRAKSDFVYSFLDSDKKTALLVIDSMDTYREMFERRRALGLRDLRMRQARKLYRRYHGTMAPQDEEAVIAGLPSATEVFTSLVQEMKAANTETLLVDLRRNSGGNSSMSDILVYMLYGKDALMAGPVFGVEVKKYSPFYLEGHPGEDFNAFRKTCVVPLTGNDYLFAEDTRGWHEDHQAGLTVAPQERMEYVATMPTFQQEYESGSFAGYYRPPHVAVLCSGQTFSAAFTLMMSLQRAGATIIGRPSGQEGNAFGSAMRYELTHSKLTGLISFMWYETFAGDDEKGHVLMPDYEMSYDRLASYDFDPNAEILYALDIFRNERHD